MIVIRGRPLFLSPVLFVAHEVCVCALPSQALAAQVDSPFVTCPLLPFLALAAQVEAKPLDQTITLASASRLITKVVGDQFTKPPWQGTLARALEWCDIPSPHAPTTR